MSSICQASSSFLALNDEDIKTIRNNNITKKVLERNIDIILHCNFSIVDPIYRNGKLELNDWRAGATALCGICALCQLLSDGLQKSLNSTTCDWDVEGVAEGEKRRVRFHLNQVEFGRLPASFLNGWENLESRGISLLIFRGSGMTVGDDHSKERQFIVEVNFEFFTNESNPLAELLNIYRRPLESSPLTELNIAKFKGWMRDCDQSHASCRSDTLRSGNTEYFLPTRLLSIDKGRDVRLVATNNLRSCPDNEEIVNYVALSYCWGSVETPGGLLMTTHQTMNSRLQKIDEKVMPQAFKDAITVARMLGIKYLWIDSLCIIQDDPPDWQKESSKMAEIFSNAYLTIAAAQGSSCNDTFLSRDLFETEIPFQIKSDRFDTTQCTLGLRFRRPNTDKMSEINQSRWVTRGWTFQEEWLARRILIFGEKKLLFSCRTLERVEDIVAHKTRPHWVDSVSSEQRNGSGSGRSEYDHWRDLCRHYTRRSLTCPEDKLPAISGIASLMAKGRSDEYLAGLWRSDLAHDLFWYPTRSASSVAEYRAPSWSWASLEGGMAWFDSRTCAPDSCRMHCIVLSAETKAHGLDPLGALAGGHLRIRGRLLEVDVCWTNDPKRYRWRLDHGGKEVARAIPDDAVRFLQRKGGGQKMWALLFATCQGGNQGPRGILLQKTGKEWEILEEFQRVGIFKVLYGPGCSEEEGIESWLALEERTIIVV